MIPTTKMTSGIRCRISSERSYRLGLFESFGNRWWTMRPILQQIRYYNALSRSHPDLPETTSEIRYRIDGPQASIIANNRIDRSYRS